MYTLFIGDLHLSADRPDIIAAFNQFLDTDAVNADALYILGDLFEVWVSDDLAEPFALALAEKLNKISQHVPIYFIHGNRDFMIGNSYANAAGMKLLPETHIISLYGKKTVLLHGDSLCTLDKKYQFFRQFRNCSLIRWIYSHLPKSWRLQFAEKLRTNSQKTNQSKSKQIMDVEPQAVIQLLKQSDASIMIHGHTHRPDIHQLAQQRQRIVVGDWYEQGSVLTITPEEIKLTNLPFFRQ